MHRFLRVGILNLKGASPYPQLEGGWSIAPNRKGATQRARTRAPHQKRPKKTPGALTLPLGEPAGNRQQTMAAADRWMRTKWTVGDESRGEQARMRTLQPDR